MIDVAFAIPGDISTPTGGYAYARHLLKLCTDHGVELHRLQLPANYPFPNQEDVVATQRTFAQLHPDTVLMIDCLAYGAMPPLVVNDIAQSIVALVHHPLAFEPGLSTTEQRKLLTFERHALTHAEKIIATSRPTAKLLMRDYSVAQEKLTVAEPGTAPALRAQGRGSPLRLLTVGAVVPRKGYTTLIEAMAHVSSEDWHLTIVGATDRDPRYATQLREAIMKSGMRGQISLAGQLSEQELRNQYSESDIFIMPSLFEGYGMALMEAIARGLPIVCTTGGAMSETAPDAAALKVPPGDAEALAAAIQELIVDRDLRYRLADESWNASRELPSWESCAETVAGVLKTVAKARR